MEFRPSKSGGHWLVLAAATLWGTTGTAQALAPLGAQPLAVGTLRMLLGGALLLLLGLLGGHLRESRRSGNGWPQAWTLLAAGCIALYQLCFFAGVARTGVAVGTIVGIGSAPVLAGVLAMLIDREWPGRRWGGATLLAVTGCVLLVAQGKAMQVDGVGILLAIGAGAAYALFTQASKKLLQFQRPAAVTAVSFSLGALLLLPLAFTLDWDWVAQPRGVLVALHLGVITMALAYSLFALGLRTAPAATAVSLTLAEPLTAGLLGIFFLGEPITLPALLGVGLLFAGLALLAWRRPGYS